MYEAAVREWVARQMNARLKFRHTLISRDDIREVRFGTQEGWPGTDVTAGDPDYTAVVFEYRTPGQTWRKGDFDIDTDPLVGIVKECIEIYDEIAPYNRQAQRAKRAAELLATTPTDPSEMGRSRDRTRRAISDLNDRMERWVHGN